MDIVEAEQRIKRLEAICSELIKDVNGYHPILHQVNQLMISKYGRERALPSLPNLATRESLYSDPRY